MVADTEARRRRLEANLAAARQRVAAAAVQAGRDPATIAIVAVTKTVPAEVAAVAYQLGLHDLGENRPQELWRKAAALPQARWHLIGHLQRNKIDRTVPLTALIHSVDSERLLTALEDYGQRRGVRVPVLIQFNCSREASKHGFDPAQWETLADQLPRYRHLDIQGLMTMAAYADDPAAARPTFAELRQLQEQLRRRTGLALPHLSMGMSHDFEAAIAEGATLLRLGTILFAGLESPHERSPDHQSLDHQSPA